MQQRGDAGKLVRALLRLLWRGAVRYWHWSLACRSWWGKVLALGGPPLVGLVLVTGVAGGSGSQSPRPPAHAVERATVTANAPKSASTSEAPRSWSSFSTPTSSGSTSGSPFEEVSIPSLPTEIPTPAPPAPTATPEPPKWSDGIPVTDESVRAALSQRNSLLYFPFGLEHPESIEISDGGDVRLSYAWDSEKLTDFVTYGAHAAYDAFRLLFANPRIGIVGVELRSHYLDRLGNVVVEPSTIIAMKRTTADQTNWDGLRVLVLKDNKRMFCSADAWFIHPLAYDALKDKGCLLQAQSTRYQ